ncbi:MAG: hypothetical protein OQK24_14640 [Magnetovibrio sp.]|nr:hypothetical protein [Magnetovibrio sp.]
MATSSPPSKAVTDWASPPRAHSRDVPLSNALDFLEDLASQGIVVAPRMPEPEALQSAALKAGISPKQALHAYLCILDFE